MRRQTRAAWGVEVSEGAEPSIRYEVLRFLRRGRTSGDAGLAQGAGSSVSPIYVRIGRGERTPGGVLKWLREKGCPWGLRCVRLCRGRRAPGCVGMGQRKRLPMERFVLLRSRHSRATGDVEVVMGKRVVRGIGDAALAPPGSATPTHSDGRWSMDVHTTRRASCVPGSASRRCDWKNGSSCCAVGMVPRPSIALRRR
jgi:hypothetical protein